MLRNTRKKIEYKLTSMYFCTEMRIRRLKAELTRSKEYNLIKENTKYKNIHKGKRCFIIGNGPSLKYVNFEHLKDEITFTVNQSPRINDFAKLHTNYHIWTDERFFEEDFTSPEGKELLEVMKSVNTKDNKPIVFYKTTARRMILQTHLDEILNISYVMEGFSLKTPSLFLPINRAVTGFPTCVQYLVLIAVYMGFSEIYLLGCDCTSILTTLRARLETSEKMEYMYECTPNEIKRIKKQRDKTPVEKELIWNADLFYKYRLLAEYCKLHGARLFNATQGGLLEGIERVALEKILKGTSKNTV